MHLYHLRHFLIQNINSTIQNFQMQAQTKHQPSQSYRIPFGEPQKWKSYLEEFGFVVIKNYLNKNACQQYVNELWTIMETLSDGKLDRNDPQTQILSKNYPVVLHGGMIQYIGHSKTQWELRSLCKPIFQQVWGSNQLKTSFDGFCFMNGRRKYKPRQNDAFLHVDQSPTKNFIWSYQGIMCLTDAGQKEGGFVCVPKSNKQHQNYFKEKKLSHLKNNWYLVPDQDKGKQPFQNVLKVNSEAGDFILFDSRTFHCNTVPTLQSLRSCTYICMIPSQKVPKEVREKRRKAFEQRRTSNHHPGDGFKMFPRVPRYLSDPKSFQKQIDKINFEYELNESQLQLI